MTTAYRNIYTKQSDVFTDLFRVSLFGCPLEEGFEVNIPIQKDFGECTLANLSETGGEIVRVTATDNLYRVCVNLKDLIDCYEPGIYYYQVVITGPSEFRLTVVEGHIINETGISITVS